MPHRQRKWVLGKWILDEGRHRLENESHSLPVRAKLMALLVFLIENYPHSVDTQEIIEKVWGNNSMMDRTSVNHAIWAARRLLNDNDINRPVIETIPRRGYRLCIEPIQIAGPGLAIS